MKIKFTNKTNKNNIYFVINGEHKIKDKTLKEFVSKFRFEKSEDFKIEQINHISSTYKKTTTVIVFVKNEKKLEKNMEDIVVQLGNIIKQVNDKFSLSFKKLHISGKLQAIFIELLAQKLYSYNEFKEDKTKFSINIDANIDKDKMIKKIEAIYFARDLMNKPANILNPSTYEDIIKDKFAKNKNVNIKVLKGEELKKIGANGIYSVGKASEYEPRMVILEYKVDKKNKSYDALVGKGVTFDSGGLNLKPTGYMEDMHMDMGGSAVALGTFKYLIETGYDKNLLCAVGIVENSMSDESYTPTDIIKMYNGKTVQITNTDAEGRLVLADTISYVEDKYNVDNLYDFATLTGAVIVALGEDIAAILGTNEKVLQSIQDRSWKLKEYTWVLPLFQKYKKPLKGQHSDLVNCARGRSAGTIKAALFLLEFVKTKNWVHFDIAGVDITKNHPIYGTGGSGVGIRLMIDVLEG